MPIRNRHRVGDYLMTDDESGLVHYASEMVKIWDGSWRHRKMFETRQPQEFVRALNDPKALRNIRPEKTVDAPTAPEGCIGNTTIVRPSGPASHLFDFLDVLFDESGGAILTESGDCLLEET